MLNERALRTTLILMVNQARKNYLMISGLGAEVMALRETVHALDPAFDEVLAEKRLKEAQTNGPIESAVVAEYDDLIRRLMVGEVC